VSVQSRRNKDWLCWTARVLSLGAGVGICIWFLVQIIADRTNSELPLPVSEFLPFFMLTLLWYVGPGVIAWWWPLVGGLLLMLQSGLVIVLIAFNYSELDGTGALPISLLVALFAGGALHLVAWWRDRRKKAEIRTA